MFGDHSAALATSPLTRALHGAKNEINVLIAQRDYLGVRDLRSRCHAEVEEQKRAERLAVLERQELERERLAEAHRVRRAKTHAAAREAVATSGERFTAHAELHAARQARHLEQFQQSVRARESRRPMVYSSTVRDLLQAEEHLVKLQLYEDADFAKRKIGAAARSERKEFREHLHARVDTQVQCRAKVLEASSQYMEERRRNEIAMARHRAAESERLIDQQFAHCAEDMAHAHRLELRQNSLLMALQCPPAMRRRRELACKGETAERAPASAGAARGTDQLRRAVGSRFEVPSLCAAHGSLVDPAVPLPPCAARVSTAAVADNRLTTSNL